MYCEDSFIVNLVENVCSLMVPIGKLTLSVDMFDSC